MNTETEINTACAETHRQDKHHTKEMNHHLRASLERALSLSNTAKRRKAIERIISEAHKALNDA